MRESPKPLQTLEIHPGGAQRRESYGDRQRGVLGRGPRIRGWPVSLPRLVLCFDALPTLAFPTPEPLAC